MTEANFIPAVGTPLTEAELLDEEGFERQLSDFARCGIRSIFTAGSMGAMQLLRDETYRRLIERSCQLWKGKGELLVGAGDTGFRRTADRIEFLNQHAIDGVVVLAPFFWKFSQDELLDYFSSLAAISRAPLYLYDLPQVTGTKIEFDTALKLAKVPNIVGIKCSDEPGYARRLVDELGPSFRVIIAQPSLIDVFLRHGLREHLDGIYGIAPHWAVALGRAASRGDWTEAGEYQRKMLRLVRIFQRYDIGAFTPLMNLRGIPGTFAPRPCRRLSAEEDDALCSDPLVQELAATGSVP